MSRFLLTHPVWDVTKSSLHWRELQEISTHTSRVGCDRIRFPSYWGIFDNFYSHIPCGMWQKNHIRFSVFYHFYSHIPCGMWQMPDRNGQRYSQFLLTHPVWDVTKTWTRSWNWHTISTHTSRVGCDVLSIRNNPFIRSSTHTSRVGCDKVYLLLHFLYWNFYSHIPCGMWPLYIVYFNHIIPIYYRMDL